MTTVINIRGRIAEFLATPNAAYVGRTGWYSLNRQDADRVGSMRLPEWARYGGGGRVFLIGDGFGNPYRVGPDGALAEVLRKFRHRVEASPAFQARVRDELAGKVLGCWCHPAPCHGSILAEFADGSVPAEAGGLFA